MGYSFYVPGSQGMQPKDHREKKLRKIDVELNLTDTAEHRMQENPLTVENLFEGHNLEFKKPETDESFMNFILNEDYDKVQAIEFLKDPQQLNLAKVKDAVKTFNTKRGFLIEVDEMKEDEIPEMTLPNLVSFNKQAIINMVNKLNEFEGEECTRLEKLKPLLTNFQDNFRALLKNSTIEITKPGTKLNVKGRVINSYNQTIAKVTVYEKEFHPPKTDNITAAHTVTIPAIKFELPCGEKIELHSLSTS